MNSHRGKVLSTALCGCIHELSTFDGAVSVDEWQGELYRHAMFAASGNIVDKTPQKKDEIPERMLEGALDKEYIVNFNSESC